MMSQKATFVRLTPFPTKTEHFVDVELDEVITAADFVDLSYGQARITQEGFYALSATYLIPDVTHANCAVRLMCDMYGSDDRRFPLILGHFAVRLVAGTRFREVKGTIETRLLPSETIQLQAFQDSGQNIDGLSAALTVTLKN